MLNPYMWLRFIHVASIAGWLGGFVAIGVMSALAGARAEPQDVRVFVAQVRTLGERLVGPSSGLAILSGLIAMFVGHVPLETWNVWGMIAVVVFVAVGVATMRPALKRIEASAAAGAGPNELRALLRRHRWLLALNTLILLSALWAMVFKPS